MGKDRGERGRPLVAPIEAPGLVRALEAAVAEAAQEEVLAHAQDREVGQPIAIDVERVGTRGPPNVRRGVLDPAERDRPGGRALVMPQRGRIRAAREPELGATVIVTVEDGDAAAHEVLPLAVVDVRDAARRGHLGEAGDDRVVRRRNFLPAALMFAALAVAALLVWVIALSQPR